MPELFTERTPAAVKPRELSHWIEWDAVSLGGGQFRALCGSLVDRMTFSQQPTCPECRAALIDLENAEF